MATLSFEGETNDELAVKVRRWLESLDRPPERVGPVEAVERLADLVDAGLAVIAAAAPEPLANNDVVSALERSGHVVTDQTARALVGGLNALAELSGDRVIARVQRAGRGAAYAMERAAAAEVLRVLRPRGT